MTRLWRVLAFALGAACLQPEPAAAAELDDLLQALAVAPAEERAAVLQRMASTDDARVDSVFSALERGALYRDRRSGTIVAAERQGSRYRLSDPFSGGDLGEAGRRDVSRIAIDNRLREQLQILQALRRLDDDDADVRLAAIREVLSNPTREGLDALEQRAPVESESTLRREIELGLAIQLLRTDDAVQIARGLDELSGRSDQSVLAAMQELLARDDLSAQTRERGERVLFLAERRIARLARVEAVFFGLSLGSVLLLAAIGLAITFGVMGVINMAHGELIMLGAYTTWLLQQVLPDHTGWALLLSVPAAFLVAGGIGWLIERCVLRFLYGRPLETLLATFGISLILQQTVRTVFSPLNRSVSAPEWLSGAWEVVPGLALTYNRLAILLFSLLVFAALLWLMRFTRLGLQVRAVAQNRAMARALGVRSARVDALTFALGSGVAGIAGVALSQLTNVGPNLGQSYIIDSFLVVVFGGVGNLWGTLLAAFSLGVANKLLEPVAGAVLAKIMLLIALILFLQRRPEGLFPKVGRQEAG